ncbi:MAG: SMC-Scp complex subunit ScpB [Oligoflexia bacterium]|nr:SMC-Scp complex subunit ScpB [Oligoflexia bacterium]
MKMDQQIKENNSENNENGDDNFLDLPLLMALSAGASASASVGDDIDIDVVYDESVVVVEASTKSETTEEIIPISEVSEDLICGAIEALVFMSERPVSLKKLKDEISRQVGQVLTLTTISNAIARLQKEYEGKHHGIRLLEVAEGYQFRTKVDYARYIQSMYKVAALMLTPSALEVLAIIAYRGPVGRPEIDKIRGVDNSHLIRALLDKKLIRVVKRADDLGRSVLYGTTDYFLEVFNLRALEDLPPEHELELMNAKQDMGDISDIKSYLHGSFHNTFTEVELAELDELSKNIKSINVDTAFTRSLKGSEALEKKGEKQEDSGSSDNNSSEVSAVVVEKAKTAFEILEEFLLRNEIVAQNKEAASSPAAQADICFAMLGIAKMQEEIAPVIEGGVETEAEAEVGAIEVEEVEEVGAELVEAVLKPEEERPHDINYWLGGDEFEDEELTESGEAGSDEEEVLAVGELELVERKGENLHIS